MRRVLVSLMGMASLVGQAADLPEYPKLHAAINAHLLAEKENYFGAVPFKPVGPSGYRPQLIDLNGDGIKEALVLAWPLLGRDRRANTLYFSWCRKGISI